VRLIAFISLSDYFVAELRLVSTDNKAESNVGTALPTGKFHMSVRGVLNLLISFEYFTARARESERERERENQVDKL
jgi:hypothetical protein